MFQSTKQIKFSLVVPYTNEQDVVCHDGEEVVLRCETLLIQQPVFSFQ